MKTLNHIFLKAKHWQLFIFIFILPAIVFGIFFITTFISIYTGTTTHVQTIEDLSWYRPLIALISMIPLLWFLCIGLGTRKLTPPAMRKKSGFFVFAIIYSCIEPLLAAWLEIAMMREIISPGEHAIDSPALFIPTVSLMILALIFCVFCTLYCMFYTARSYKSAELQQNPRFEDYIVECIYFIFPFIGVWMIQPEINKMADKIISAGNGQNS